MLHCDIRHHCEPASRDRHQLFDAMISVVENRRTKYDLVGISSATATVGGAPWLCRCGSQRSPETCAFCKNIHVCCIGGGLFLQLKLNMTDQLFK
jgi:hypothetical protein